MNLRVYFSLIFFLSFSSALRAQPLADFQKFQLQVDSLYYAAEYQLSAELLRNSFTEGLPDSITAYLHYKLGTVTLELAVYSQAEEELLAAKALYSKLYSSHHEIVASVLSRLAVLWSEQGRFADAVTAVTEQLEAYKIEFGEDNRFTTLAAIALGEYKLQAKDIKGAESIATQYAPIVAKTYSPKSIELARLKKLEGNISFAKQQYALAQASYTSALSALPPDRPMPSIRGAIELERARTLSILEKDKEALSDIRNAIIDIQASRNAATLLIARCYLIAGSIEENLGHRDSTLSDYSKALDTYKKVTKENFRYTSERERLAFLRDVKYNSGRVFSTVIRNVSINPKIAGFGYDWSLFQKALLLSSIVSVRSQSRATNDTALTTLLDKLAILHTRKSAFYSSDRLLPSKPLRTIDSIDQFITDLEKQLARRSSAYARFSTIGWTKSSAIRQKLSKNSAAIEITTFPYFHSEQPGDSLFYAAFIVTESDHEPKVVFPGTATVLEDSAIIREYYRTIEHGSARSKKSIAKISMLLWSQIEPSLHSVRTLYVSPDGIYCRISLQTLMGNDNASLLDTYTITTLASTADLLRDTDPLTSDMVILAGPNFGPSGSSRRKQLVALPATVTEAKGIANVFQKQQLPITTLFADEASEENLRKVRRPGILHIATHGCFDEYGRSDATTADLLRTSLYFSGANKTLSSRSVSSKNDGILTGLEATDLDLEGTSLVTLSACESGRGTIEPGEGVFGLPRAFRIAGARNILMTLWRIPDKETAELMTAFYQNLAEGQSKPEALRNAQLTMRQIIKKRYNEDIPQFWAGFVLIGF